MQALRDAKRLATAVLDRRSQLGLSQEEFAERGGLASKTVLRVERGEMSPRPKTLGGIDRAAEWEPGSARRVLEGGAATPLRVAAEVPTDPELRELYDRARGALTHEEAMDWVRMYRSRRDGGASETGT